MKKKIRTKNFKKIYFGITLLFLIVLISGFIFKNTETLVPHNNIVDSKISLNSNRNITLNAIIADPEFKNITFDPKIPKTSFFSNQMATVVRTIKSFTTNRVDKEPKEHGSWIWTPIMYMTPEYIESVLTGAEANGINAMYVSIDSYLDVFILPKGPERERQKKIFSDKLEDFIIRANRKGIAVDAEAGWQNWAEDGNTYKALAIVNFVKNFNETHENKFRGFQYDVEPYLLSSYEEDKAEVLKKFVRLIDQTEYFIGSSNLKFSVVIPDFYDQKDKLTPRFSYGGKKDYVLKHLLNILDRRPDSSIIVMSYRNFADGPDGSIEVSKNEMATADKGAYQTEIIIAQETGDVPPPYITFHNTPKKYFNRQVEKINTAFDSHKNFGGIALHYINAFLALK